MEIINGSDRMPGLKRPLYLALGNFDGVHRGHQAIIRDVVLKAKNEGGISAALVLDPHPVLALRPEKKMALLTDIADRAEIMGELGLEYLIVEPFTEILASYSPERFIRDILVEKLTVKELFIGSNYRFGRKGEGCSVTLSDLGNKYGYNVNVSSMISYNNRNVSSSLIRSLLLAGAVNEAADFLNYYFYRYGRVIRGHGIGKRLVYPTANIYTSERLIWPGEGVYLTAVGRMGEGLYFGVTNVGTRPTFADYNPGIAETHILDFEGNIYSREIRLCFLEKLRDTKFFQTVEELRDQISRDIELSRDLIKLYRKELLGSDNSLQAGCTVLRSTGM